MADQTPTRYNLGGIWLFNPPEPAGNTTDLRGLSQQLGADWVFPTGGAMCVPDVWQLEVGGTSGGDEVVEGLLGTHYLHRQRPEGALQTLLGNRLGHWATPAVELVPDVPEHAWSLTYGPINLLAGPYADGFQFTEAWWLMAWLGTFGPSGFELERAEYVYQLLHPEADEDALATITSPATPGSRLSQKLLFDGLGGNVFQYAPPSGGLITDAPGGNTTLTIRPAYP